MQKLSSLPLAKEFVQDETLPGKRDYGTPECPHSAYNFGKYIPECSEGLHQFSEAINKQAYDIQKFEASPGAFAGAPAPHSKQECSEIYYI